MTENAALPGGNSQPEGACILLVEDSDEFRYATEKVLREAGFDVKAAADYQTALNLLVKPDRIDLLLTDILMPDGINGFALARMARMRRQELRILYMTAFDVPEHEAVAKILRKPMTPANLVDEIKLALAA